MAEIMVDSGIQTSMMMEEEKPKEASMNYWDWTDFGLRWLFNPYRFDHLPIEEQVLKYQRRNLLRSKVYKFGCRVFGESKGRPRVIVAPSMDKCTTNKEIKHSVSQSYTVDLPTYTPTLKTTQSIDQIQEELKQYTDKEDSYNEWLRKRQKFRGDLDNMGLNEMWLSRKPDKTPIEQRVLQRLLRDKYPRPVVPEPAIEEPLQAILAEDSPLICRPSPLALQIIERFLAEKRMRLLDLFSNVDKDKDWLVSRDEFRNAIKQAKIPLPDDLLEDLIITLDTDLDEKLDYRELAKGLELWKQEKRESKRKRPGQTVVRPVGHPSVSVRGTSTSSASERSASPLRESPWQENRASSPAQRVKSALSTISSGSSRYLETPDLDLRPEQRIDTPEAMVDLRKRNRETLSRLTGQKGKPVKKKRGTTYDTKSMLKTGDASVDYHMQPSTLGAETAEQVDRFRQLRLQEYHMVCQMCDNNNIPLSKILLEKVLLFPPDHSHAQIKRSLRKSGGAQWSRKIMSTTSKSGSKNVTGKRNPSPDYNTPSPHRKKMVYHDLKSSYPTKKSISSSPTKVHLSTGRAVISTQVDCWMSFEEYDQLTRHLGSKYTELHGRSDDNAFWPGHLLDKIRLCMPNSEPKYNSVFRTVRAEKKTNLGYNNDLRTWPVGDLGHIQYGFIDPYKNKYIHS